jgi:hypothetical protein
MSISIEDLATSELLPQFAIRKIVISEDKVTLSCALNRPREVNYENWLGSSEFNSYIKYYFIAAPDLSSETMSRLYYPQVRIERMHRARDGEITSWERSLGPQRSPSDLENPYNFKGYTSLTLGEILQGQHFAKDALTAIETVEPVDPYLLDNSEGYNTSFQVSIDLVNNPFAQDVTKLNILAFAQLDIRRLKEDFGLEVLSSLSRIGSELLYENCLTRDISSIVDPAPFIVPEERTIFFSLDGLVYSGPAHHSPGFNGYVGWLSGPPTDDLTNRIRLEHRKVPNRKVVSRLFQNRALNYAGQALTADNTYSGYADPAVQQAPDPGQVGLGEQIIRTLRSQLGQILSQTSVRYHDKLRELSILSVKRGKINLALAGIPISDLSWISTNGPRPYHGSIFLIKLGEILASNSRFGYLYNLHKSVQGSSSSQLLTDMISRSRIQNFSVFRRRLTNSPIGNNSLSTAAYETYDNNEKEKNIVQTSAGPNTGGISGLPRLATNSNDTKATISEGGAFTGELCTVLLKDYDLFENVHTGKYEYVIDITLEDGILKLLSEKHKEFKAAIEEFSTYVKEANRPYQDYNQSGYYNGSQFADGLADQRRREEAGTTGNYNHSTGEFTEAFKTRSMVLRSRSDNVVKLSTEIDHILTGNPPPGIVPDFLLKNSLLALTATLDSLEDFLDLCLEISARFGTMLRVGKADIKDTLNLGSHRRNVSKGTRYPDKLINLRGTAHILATAVSKNSLFVRPAWQRVVTSSPSTASEDPRARSQRNQRSTAPAGLIFGLSNTTGTKTRSSSGGSTEIQGNGVFSIEMIADATAAKTPEERSRLNARIKAAIELSEVGPLDAIKDDLIELDNLLGQYGGTKLQSMLEEVNFTSKSEIDNKVAEKSRFVTNAFQQSVLSSILTSDNPEMFMNQIEEKYKDIFYKKQALSDLYDVVKSALATHNLMKQARSATTFKEKVQEGTNNQTKREKEISDYDTADNASRHDIFTAYTIDQDGNLIPMTADNQTDIVVYKSKDSIFDGAIVVDNVQIVSHQN